MMGALRRSINIAALLVVSGTGVVLAQPSRAADTRGCDYHVLDGHNDLPWKLRDQLGSDLAAFDFRSVAEPQRSQWHTDLARLKAGCVGGQFWSVYVPAELTGAEAVKATLQQIDLTQRLIDRHPEKLQFATSSNEIERAMKGGRIASLLGAEGAHSIGGSLAVLRQLHRLGVRYLTLTHTKNNELADSSADTPTHAGLSPFGVAAVREMNRLGMLVDLSHVSAATMHDALDASLAPVIFSHSNSFAKVPHHRNVPDEVLRQLRGGRGLVMVSFVAQFNSAEFLNWVSAEANESSRLEVLYPADEAAVTAKLEEWKRTHPQPRVTVSHVADHIDHIRQVAGIGSVGIGGDLDGTRYLAQGLESAAGYPLLFEELKRRGYSESELRNIASGNVLRVLRAAEAVAHRLAAETKHRSTPLERSR